MLTIQGKITSNSTENGKQLVTVSNEEETKIVVLQDTYLIDAETGFRMMPEEMLGREVRAYIKGGETAAILTISEQAVANYAEIEAIEKQADGNLLVTTDEGSRVVTISKEAEISPWLTRNIVMLQDLQVGSKVLLYYDLMTMSLPAQAYTEKVILLAK